MKFLLVSIMVIISQCGTNQTDINVDVKMRHYCETVSTEERAECFKDFHELIGLAIDNNNGR